VEWLRTPLLSSYETYVELFFLNKIKRVMIKQLTTSNMRKMANEYQKNSNNILCFWG
jgi:hypothetical protein